MNSHFGLIISSALLLFSTLLNGNQNNDQTLYGVCYQFNTANSNSPQIIASKHSHIVFEDYGFETVSNDPIDCIWFTSNDYAHSASTMNIELAQQNFNNNDNVQESIPGQESSIYCNNQRIRIAHKSDIISNHLCSDVCHTDHQQLCSSLVTERSIPLSYQGQSDVSPLIPSMFGISGICIAFIIICVVIYCFGVRYSRWNEEKSGNETEQVIGDVLDEIAKYTIGDDEEEGFYGDWIDADSDRSDSTHSDEEALGMTILRVVSNQQLPEIPNPSIYSSGSSEDESNEEECLEDLKVAKETLYATSNGTDNPYLRYIKNLSPINEKLNDNEEIIERKISINNNQNTPKKSPLLSGGESSDYKISSDGCNNSDLP